MPGCVHRAAGCRYIVGDSRRSLAVNDHHGFDLVAAVSSELRRKVLDPEHPDTLMAMNNLAIGYQDAGRKDEALKLFESALAWIFA